MAKGKAAHCHISAGCLLKTILLGCILALLLTGLSQTHFLSELTLEHACVQAPAPDPSLPSYCK